MTACRGNNAALLCKNNVNHSDPAFFIMIKFFHRPEAAAKIYQLALYFCDMEEIQIGDRVFDRVVQGENELDCQQVIFFISEHSS